MTTADFRALLARAGLTQTELSTLTGLSPTAINRYCSPAAADRRPVPRDLLVLVLAWSMLSERHQASLRAKLAEIEASTTVAIYCFHRGWAKGGPDGPITGWTDQVADAGRWRRKDAPAEFGTVQVEDALWPAPPGVAPIYPAIPPRPAPPRKRRRRTRELQATSGTQ